VLRVLFDFFAARLYVQQPAAVETVALTEAPHPTLLAHSDSDETA
jgi:hypothetical protein